MVALYREMNRFSICEVDKVRCGRTSPCTSKLPIWSCTFWGDFLTPKLGWCPTLRSPHCGKRLNDTKFFLDQMADLSRRQRPERDGIEKRKNRRITMDDP